MIDLIKSLDDAYCKLRYGPGVLLEWPYASGTTGADVERMLRSYGVRVYARQYATRDGDNYGLHVPEKQAKWARYLCRRSGLPLVGERGRGQVSQAPRSMPRHQVQRNGKPRPGARAAGMAGRVLEWLG